MLKQIDSWFPGLKDFGLQLLGAALILFIGFRLAKWLKKLSGKTLERMETEISLRRFLPSTVYVFICGIAIFMAAEQVGVSSASIIALLGSAGLALSLSLQNVLTNFAGGVILLVVKPFTVGDYIICGTEEGTVSSIGLVYTTLQTMDNRSVVLPNGSLSNSNLTNVTAQEKRRLELKVGIGYDSDLKKAKEIMRELFEQQPQMLIGEGIQVFVSELAEDAVVIGARGWLPTESYWPVRWELTEAVKLRFDEAGIRIPYRQLDVYMKKEE